MIYFASSPLLIALCFLAVPARRRAHSCFLDAVAESLGTQIINISALSHMRSLLSGCSIFVFFCGRRCACILLLFLGGVIGNADHQHIRTESHARINGDSTNQSSAQSPRRTLKAVDQRRQVITQFNQGLTAAIVEEVQFGTVVLGDGTRIPRMGYGTGSRLQSQHILGALEAGYRLIDTAVAYKRETKIAEAIRSSGLTRSDIFIVSKAWPFADHNRTTLKNASELVAQVEAHISAMRAGYLDVLLLHWPSSGLCEHWGALVSLKSRGKTRSIGLSNVGAEHIKTISDCSTDMPAVVQSDLGPIKIDSRIEAEVERLIPECQKNGIVLMAHSLLRSSGQPRVIEMSNKANITVPHLLLRYGLQRGFIVLFGSRSIEHMRSNLRVFGTELSAATMTRMACWRGEPRCGEVYHAIGRQNSRHVLRHFHSHSSDH
jgi:diketogulonate reductase-like aldo/keto reductase